ncbi:MAG TPA: sodium:solute symporter family protein [Chryseosolibacter sp.]
MLLTSIILYLTVTILIGFWASRRVRTSTDFMLAGRSLPLLLGSSALFATWFGSETVFGASSQFLEGGLYAVIEDPFGAALCLLLFGVFFARKLYRMNLLTLGDFFKVRYGRSTELVACIFLAPPYVGYIAAQLVAMGLILNVVAGVSLAEGIAISAFVVTLYTLIGGMWAITITDFVQTLIIIGGLVVVAVSLGIKAGGVTHVLSIVPPENFKFLPSPDLNEVVAYVAAWAVLGFGSIPSQDVFQRAMSSRSPSVAAWSCYIAALLYLTIAMLPLFICLCVKHLYPEQVTGDTQLTLPNMVLSHMSMPVQILFFGSLLSAIMSTTSSAILAPASILSENFIKPLTRQRFRDKHFLFLTRICVLIFSILATVMATLRSNIYELVGESSILSLVSLFAPLTFGLYWKRSSSAGALLSMMLGMLTWIIFEFYNTAWPSLVPATLVSIGAIVAGSLIWPDKGKRYD